MGRAWAFATVLFSAAAVAEEFEGEITSGKAKQLADEGTRLCREADAIYDLWFLGKLPEVEQEPQAKKAADLYRRGADRLALALESKYSRAVDAVLLRATSKASKLEFFLLGREMERKPRAPAPPEEPAAPPESPPAEAPAPAPPAPPGDPPASPERNADGPPAVPLDVDLGRDLFPVDGKQRKADLDAIQKFLRDWCDARREKNLLFKHVPCGGTGKGAGGGACAECGGTGRGVNLHHFRRAFWNCYSPALRNAPGALEAIRAYYERARADTKALGPMVRAFQLGRVEHHGRWVRVQLREETTEGPSDRFVTLLNAAGRWCFYAPATDGELLPR